MQSPPHESRRQKKHPELVAIARMASTACLRTCLLRPARAGERARRWRQRCPDARQILQALSKPLCSVWANRRFRVNDKSARHRSNSSSTITPRPRSVRRPMRCIIICSTRCPAPTLGSTTEGQRVSAFAPACANVTPATDPRRHAAACQPLIMRRRTRSLRTK